MTFAVPEPPPQPKKSSTWKIVVIVVAAVLAVCCVGAIIAGYFGFRVIDDATGPAKDAATTYLSHVESGEFEQGYEQLCRREKAARPLAAYLAMQRAQPDLTGFEVTGVNVSNMNGNVTGTVRAQLTREAVGTFPQQIALVKEDGQWRVCQAGI